MNENPYESPRAVAEVEQPGLVQVVPNKLRIPATALIVLGAITIFICPFALAILLSTAITKSQNRLLMSVLILEYLAMFASNATVIYGAQQARRAKSYRWAMVAAVVSIIPILSPFGYLGIPFGIWMLIVLLRKDIKACFPKRPQEPTVLANL